ncbi:MAG TPA: carboxyl transferase domain-containing protein [Candidatus Udaeobacter sp.]
MRREEAALREGGGKPGHERHRKMGRLPVRERRSHLLDKDAQFFEIGLWAAYKMYEQRGKIPAAGVVTGIGNVADVPCMIIANDATVEAGAFFPQTTTKVIRAQRIAFKCAFPIIYLVDLGLQSSVSSRRISARYGQRLATFTTKSRISSRERTYLASTSCSYPFQPDVPGSGRSSS